MTPNRKRAIIVVICLAMIASVIIRVARRSGFIDGEDDIIFTDTIIPETESGMELSDYERETLFNFEI